MLVLEVHTIYKRIKVEKLQVVEEVTSAYCDNCGADIKLVSENLAQGEGALEVSLHGGYDMYFDYDYAVMVDTHATNYVLLCKSCADKLIEVFPCMKEVIDNA